MREKLKGSPDLTPEQVDASECLHEAMRIVNSEIRHAVASGLDVKAMLLTMRSTRTKAGIPQISFAAQVTIGNVGELVAKD